MSYNKIITGIVCYTLLACAICGCGSDKGTSTDTAKEAGSISYLDASSMFTDRDKEVGYDEDTATIISLADDASSCDSSDVTVTDNTVTIGAEGTYLLSGNLQNGQIIVDADDAKVQLVFDSVNINCDTSAAVYVKKADKVFITLADGSDNTLSNTQDFVAIDDNNIDGVIFSKSDLTLNGSGSLTVSAAYGHGIVSKDDLVITSGTYLVTAAKHALSGKDSVRIAEGTLTLTAGTDGIHSENTDKEDKGFIYIAGGDIDITSESDGFDAEYTLQIDGGNIEVAAGDDGVHSDGDLIITDGTITVTKSYEGLEGMTITIEGGDMNIVSSDDGLNAAGDGTSSDSSDSSTTDNTDTDNREDFSREDMTPPTNQTDDTQTTDSQNPPELPSGDNSDMQNPPELPSGDNSDSNDFRKGGRDDFQNGDMGKGGGGGGMDAATDYNLIQISGGTLYVDADGDGIDSNGNLTISGGEIYVNGPTNGGNGALDYAGTATITGGTVIAVGASGMAQNFSSDSTQGSMLVTVASSTLTGDLALADANGDTLLTFSPSKNYNSVVISAPSLAEGETYTLTTGDVTTEVEMTSLIYGDDDMGGGFGGGMGGGKMQDGTMPDGKMRNEATPDEQKDDTSSDSASDSTL